MYTFLSAILALLAGFFFNAFAVSNKAAISNLVVALAILTIYPSMVQLRTDSLLKSFRSWRQILLSVFYIFVLSPALAFLMASTLGDPYVGVGYVVANTVPASSASLGYVLIAGGNIELATALAILSLFVGIPAIPAIIGIYCTNTAVPLLVEPIIASLLEVLILPLVAGQLTRYAIARKRGPSYVDKNLKSYLSLATMLSMLALVFVLVFNQYLNIITNFAVSVLILAYQAIVILGLLSFSLILSRILRISYEDHQAVALISITKNQSVAAAIAVSALGPKSALTPALVPLIQPILIVAYLHAEEYVKKFLAFKKH